MSKYVSVILLSEWLLIESVSKLDTAYCNKVQRPKLFMILQSSVCKLNKFSGSIYIKPQHRERFIAWLLTRNISMNFLDLSDWKNLSSNVLTALLDISKFQEKPSLPRLPSTVLKGILGNLANIKMMYFEVESLQETGDAVEYLFRNSATQNITLKSSYRNVENSQEDLKYLVKCWLEAPNDCELELQNCAKHCSMTFTNEGKLMLMNVSEKDWIDPLIETASSW